MSILQALLIAIIEGLTEFLPISSTGHMVILSYFLGLDLNSNFVKFYIVSIQLGAIMAVVVLYFKRFFKSFQFYFKLFIAFIPVAILGFKCNDIIDKLLETPVFIAIAFVIVGVVLLFIDRFFASNTHQSDEDLSTLQAFKIGCFQCIALFPGVSRSAVTIIGGMKQGLTKQAAATFSFLLAVPVMFAATAKKCLDCYQEHIIFSKQEILLILFGNVVAFFVAFFVIKVFIKWIATIGFRPFGWYRIILGMFLLVLFCLS